MILSLAAVIVSLPAIVYPVTSELSRGSGIHGCHARGVEPWTITNNDEKILNSMQETSATLDDFSRFDLVAKHLWPTFGNIYEYNLHGGDAGLDPQEWTVELKEAVRDYLLHELPEEVAPYLFELDAETLKNAATKRDAVDALITGFEPWEVALAVQRAAIKAVPTLDDLIGHLNKWPSEEEHWEVEEWLLEHAGDDVLEGLVDNLAKDPSKDPFTFSFYDLTHQHQPYELLAMWYQAGGATPPSDLTDAEWELLVPLLPRGRNRHKSFPLSDVTLAVRRRAYNGIRYKLAYGVPWNRIPTRYGRSGTVQQRHFLDKKDGVFMHMARSLQDVPEATRLVTWLQSMVVTDVASLQQLRGGDSVK